MSRIEIDDFPSFFTKFAEVCYVTALNLKNEKDPTDEEWDVIEEVHRIFLNGRLTFWKTVLDEEQTKATQVGLFA